TFECSCGTPSRVLLNFRKVYRKNLKLAGKFTLSSGTSKIEGHCIVLDLSRTGMRVRPVSSQNVAKRQFIDVHFAFDDQSRTELDLHCTVCRIASDLGPLIQGLEFELLNPFHQ